MRLALQIVGKALFSIDLSDQAHRLTQAVLTALEHIVHRPRNPLSPPDWMHTRRNRKFREAVSTLDVTVYDLISQRRRQSDQGNDLLGMLMKGGDPDRNAPISEKQIRDEVITILVAGHETVASAISWAWHLLAHNPPAWEAMRQEVNKVLGNRPPTAADLPKLDYAGRVFFEAMRLYPPRLGHHPPGNPGGRDQWLPDPARLDGDHQPLHHPLSSGVLAAAGTLRPAALCRCG